MRLATALIAVAIVAATIYLGRRDLSRPPVVFGAIWFGFVALAQLHLTPADNDWPLGFTAVVFGGGLAFMTAAIAAAGTAPARGTTRLVASRYDTRRLWLIVLLLMCGAVVGWIYKRHVLGGIPLLSGDTDVVRGRAFTAGGEAAIPAWASALTGGFYIALWILVAVAAIEWRSAGIRRRAALAVLAAACLFGVALDGSRNLVLLAIVVPGVAAYVLARRATVGKALLRAFLGLAVIAAVVGGVFVARLAQTTPANSGNTFLRAQLRSHSAVAKPLLPIYVNGVLPLDGYRQLWGAFPDRAPWGRGGYSLTSLPDAAFPAGKLQLGGVVSGELAQRGAGFWTVATYQGRAYADLGAGGVISMSILIGLMFGSAYRFARGRSGLFALAVIGYVAYYSAFMLYDNLLSFTLIGIYDLAVVFVAERIAQHGWPKLHLPRASPLAET
jgi:hypothetical protein